MSVYTIQHCVAGNINFNIVLQQMFLHLSTSVGSCNGSKHSRIKRKLINIHFTGIKWFYKEISKHYMYFSSQMCG